MKKKSLSLAQLAMIFNQAETKFYCIGRDVYEICWLSDYVFGLPERIRDLQFVHCSERPNNEDCAFFFGFVVEEGNEEFFAVRGNNNEVLATFCDIFVQYAKLIRAANYESTKKKSEAVQACLADCLVFDTTELGTPNAKTEFVWKTGTTEYLLAKFDKTIDLPYDFFEQRKVAADDSEHSWGSKEDELSNNRKTEMPLSEIIVRYLSSSGDDEPIEIPLRIDSTPLPAWLFDHVLMLGLSEPDETGKVENAEDSAEN